MLNIIDEFTHECLAIRVARKLNSIDVIDDLSDLFILRGVPAHIRSDNGPEFVAKAVQEWIGAVGAKTAYIEPGSPGRTAMSRASMRGCATSCSTARSSTRSGRRRSSSKGGGGITIACVPIPPSATSRPLRRSWHGRHRQLLRALRRPWRRVASATKPSRKDWPFIAFRTIVRGPWLSEASTGTRLGSN